MTTASDENVEPGRPRIVHVQQAVGDCAVDDYRIEGGYQVVITSNDDRELWVHKTEDATNHEFVAMYAQGLWLRAWVEEETD